MHGDSPPGRAQHIRSVGGTGGRNARGPVPCSSPHELEEPAIGKRTTLENRFYDLYIEFFAHAEANRRWNVFDDIPWTSATRTPDPEVASLVETYYGVELYLPDYVHHTMRILRRSRGRAWFQANWGYEESKHSLALERWLIHSGARSQEEVQQFEDMILQRSFEPFDDDALYGLCYLVFQEFTTGLTYQRFRAALAARGAGDPALLALLGFLHRDEVAHFGFFRRCLEIYMDYDRDLVVDGLGLVLSRFQMPADHLIPDWTERHAVTRKWQIMNDRIFLTKVAVPVLASLGVDRAEMRALRKQVLERGRKALPDAVARIGARVEEHDRALALAAPSREGR
jgi:acyl-[acyl-carrier-protein] desaturase